MVGVLGIVLNFLKPFLLKNWKLVVALLILGSAAWYVHSLKSHIEDLTEEKNQLILDLENCRLNVGILEMAIEDQNAAIDAAVQAGQRAEQRIADLQNRISELTVQYEQEIEDILNQPKPETCEEAIEFLKNTEGLRWDD